MNHYMKKLIPYLEENIDREEMLKQLYSLFQELHPQDSSAVRLAFSKLNSVLAPLTLQEQDLVWDLACVLCAESEKQAFLEGMRVGVQLCYEGEE